MKKRLRFSTTTFITLICSLLLWPYASVLISKEIKKTKKTNCFSVKKVNYKTFNELFQILYTIIQEKRSHWSNAQTSASVLECLIEECYELKEALKNQDYAQAEDELGDILGMVLQLGLIAERDHLFQINKASALHIKKMHRRSPYIFDEELGKEVTNLTQAIELWYSIKKKEKEAVKALVKD